MESPSQWHLVMIGPEQSWAEKVAHNPFSVILIQHPHKHHTHTFVFQIDPPKSSSSVLIPFSHSSLGLFGLPERTAGQNRRGDTLLDHVGGGRLPFLVNHLFLKPNSREERQNSANPKIHSVMVYLTSNSDILKILFLQCLGKTLRLQGSVYIHANMLKMAMLMC